MAGAFPGASVIVYTAGLLDGEEVWIPQTVNGEQNVRVTPVATGEGTLGEVALGREPIVFAGSELTREDFAHLDIRRTLRSLACLPLESDGELLGVVEILSFENEIKTTGLKDAETFYGSCRRRAAKRVQIRKRTERFAGVDFTFDATLRFGKIIFVHAGNGRAAADHRREISRSDGMRGGQCVAAAWRRKSGVDAPGGYGPDDIGGSGAEAGGRNTGRRIGQRRSGGDRKRR